ncbi:MAG: pyruvate carboxylase, partial [Deltaproteobacteria bacterium]|nr:pyruvate carboxylase [Deltaproteobacteria bacterium]
DPNNLPLAIWFEGMAPGEEINFIDSRGKPHHMSLLLIQEPDPNGVSVVRYVLDSEIMSTEVQVSKPKGGTTPDIRMADPENIYHVGSPSNGDLWVMYVNPGDIVKKGEELFNISIMKQEKAILAPIDGIVKSVMKTADYRETKKMVHVLEGELIVELGPVTSRCANPQCAKVLPFDSYPYCPFCGNKNY